MRLLPILPRVLVALLAGAALASSSAAQNNSNTSASRSVVVRATLANGLRVVIVRNTLAPVVATSVNYMVGSDEAPAGFPGTAHRSEEHTSELQSQ